MFQTVKFIYKIVALLFSVYLIQYTGFETTLAVMTAVLLVTGPDGLEAYLTRQGYLDAAETKARPRSSDRSDGGETSE